MGKPGTKESLSTMDETLLVIVFQKNQLLTSQ